MTQKIKNYDELYQEAASHAFSLCGIPGEVMPVQEAISRKFAELVRNAALEEAAKHCQACSRGETQTDGQFAALQLAQQIRSLKS